MKVFIATNLPYIRKRNNWTQAKLADELGIKCHCIGSYEEKRSRPTYEVLAKLSAISGFTIHELIAEDLSKNDIVE